MTSRSRHRLVRAGRRLASAALVVFAGCRFGAPAGSDVQGRHISDLYVLMFWISIGVAAIVYGLILWSVLRYRRRSDELPRQFQYHIPLEVLYTVIPLLIVIGLFLETYHVERPIDRVDAPYLTVRVTAFQWGWRFEYPAYGFTVEGTGRPSPVMVVPAGKTIEIDLTADDVIHAFFVPDFLFKRDAIPGMMNRFDLTIPEPGRWRGECAEFCGLDHSSMGFFVKAVPAAQFDTWAASHGANP